MVQWLLLLQGQDAICFQQAVAGVGRGKEGPKSSSWKGSEQRARRRAVSALSGSQDD